MVNSNHATRKQRALLVHVSYIFFLLFSNFIFLKLILQILILIHALTKLMKKYHHIINSKRKKKKRKLQVLFVC